MEIGAVGQGEFILTKLDPPLNRPVIIVITGRLDQSVDSVHLHGDLFADRDIPADDRISECTIVARDGGVG